MNSAGGGSTMIYFIFFIGILVCVGIIILIYNIASAESILSEMGKSLEAKNYQKVIDLAHKFIKKRSADFWIYNYMAQGYEGLNQYRRSIENYEKALVDLENHNREDMRAEILLKLGELSNIIKKPEQALGYFELVLRDHPRNTKALWSISQINYEMKKYMKAKDSLENFILQKPKFLDSRYLLAKVYNKLAEYQKSVIQLDKWFELKKEMEIPIALYNESLMLLADNYLALKRYADSIKVLKPLLNDDNLRPKVLLKVVTCLIKNSDYRQAIQIGSDYLLKIPRDDRCGILYEIGTAYLLSGEIYQALEAWQSAYELNPSYQDLDSILLRYDVLKKNPSLQYVYNTNEVEFEDYILKKYKQKDDSIIEKQKEFWILKDQNQCFIIYKLPYPVPCISMETIQDILARQGLANTSIILFSLFSVDNNCKNNSFYKRIREISEDAFLAFFKD